MGGRRYQYLGLGAWLSLSVSCDELHPPTPFPPLVASGGSGVGGSSGGGTFFGSGGALVVDIPVATGGAICDDPTDEGLRACQPDATGAGFECVVTDLPPTCSGAPDYSVAVWALSGQGGLGGQGGQGGDGSASLEPAPLGACPRHPDPPFCQYSLCVGSARLLPNDRVECCYLLGQIPCP